MKRKNNNFRNNRPNKYKNNEKTKQPITIPDSDDESDTMDLETRRKILIPKRRLTKNNNNTKLNDNNPSNHETNENETNPIDSKENNQLDNNKKINSDEEFKEDHMTNQEILDNKNSGHMTTDINKDDNKNLNNNSFSSNIIDSKNNSSNELNKNINNKKEDKLKIKPPRHIKLIKDKEDYNITKDLLNTPSNITFAQLLDCSPRIRAELIKNLKLEKSDKKDIC